jgi:2,4-dienoyl-CoA reductase-like NADH-dependent reductase (Old Yellow Enzyme family)/NADPH-dependent 2,4-dienoyl-CoA reductase/sulfur reductase-like enzyme
MGLLMMLKDGTYPQGMGHDHYPARARGGYAEVIVGEISVDTVWANRSYMGNTDFEKPEGPQKATWRRLAADIKNAGALAFVQLAHAGAMRTGRGDEKGRPVAMGPMGYTRANGEKIIAADEKIMQQVIESFGRAAAYMKDAGFDGIQVHGGHGWMLQQWLSPRTNHRTDEYGGSTDNRCRFPVRIMKRIRERVGDDFIIELRVSGEEPNFANGMKKEQIARLAQLLEGVVDIMHISVGLYNMPIGSRIYSNMYHEHFCNLEQAAFVKANTKNMLVTMVGGVNNPEEADRFIGEGKLDFVSMARQMTADINFPNKCMAGHPEDINRCLRCSYCMMHTKDKEGEAIDMAPAPMGPAPSAAKDGKQLPAPPPMEQICSVNPEYGVTIPEGGWPKVTRAKKVLVIGGGCAGMTAAITAADRGHNVTLVEKTDKLGGILKFTDNDTFKYDLKNYKDLLIRRVGQRKIRVLLNTEADAALVAREAPDFIIAAVGASASKPDMPGIEHTIPALDTYYGAKLGKNVVIVGGGLTGCETAISIAAEGKKVTILKRSAPIAHDAPEGTRQVICEEFAKYGIKYFTDLKFKGIAPNGVTAVNKEGIEYFYPADSIVCAMGMNPNTKTVAALRSAAGNTPFQAVGDCTKAADVAKAQRAAYIAAIGIA